MIEHVKDSPGFEPGRRRGCVSTNERDFLAYGFFGLQRG